MRWREGGRKIERVKGGKGKLRGKEGEREGRREGRKLREREGWREENWVSGKEGGNLRGREGGRKIE